MATSERLDLELVERGLAESRNRAQRLIMAGQVRVNGQLAIKSSQSVATDDRIEVERGPKYVSRGGQKLEAALQAFPVTVENSVCADIGASTGGFTDCLLQYGARRVYAVDVGRGQLHWSLRQDERVVVMEGTNARYLEALPEPIDLLTIDASFISLRLLLPAARAWMAAAGQAIALIKPQFEAGRDQVGKGGVVREREIRRSAVLEVLQAAAQLGWSPQGLIRSPLTGPKGNAEFLAWLRLKAQGQNIDQLLEAVFANPSRQ